MKPGKPVGRLYCCQNVVKNLSINQAVSFSAKLSSFFIFFLFWLLKADLGSNCARQLNQSSEESSDATDAAAAAAAERRWHLLPLPMR